MVADILFDVLADLVSLSNSSPAKQLQAVLSRPYPQRVRQALTDVSGLVARALPTEYKATLGGDPSTDQTEHPLPNYSFCLKRDVVLRFTITERAKMGNMATEIVAFLLTISGWILISSTLPTDYWKVSSVDGTVITTATFWSNLWKTCVTDSTGVSNCKDFPSMLALDAILALVGMKCTKIGGSETTKARITCLCGLHFILSGICSMTACSLYAHRITSEFFDPLFVKQKFELGAALFIGWAGSVLSILGGFLFCFSMSEGFSIRITKMDRNPETPHKVPPDQSFSGRQFGRNAFNKLTRAKMKIRVMQIWGFLLALLGWIFVACSMAMEGWKITSIGGQGGSAVIKVGWYWSSLWRACFTDSSSTSNCYDFPVLWSVEVLWEWNALTLEEKTKRRTDPCSQEASVISQVITGGIFFLVSVCKIRAQTYSRAPVLSVPVVESNALRSSNTNISIISELSTKSKVSAISELSSKSETTALSNAPSKSTRVSKTGRPSRSRRADQQRSSIESDVSRSVSSSRMRQGTVVMYVEIGCFLVCLSGWILICSTLVTEYWTFSEVGSVVLTTGNFYSNLWMDCVSDTTGVSDCKYYPSMMDLSVFLHVCRALAVVSVIFGFWGAVLALIGMKCTKIGGSELTNARITFAAALTYMASGFCGMIVYSWWGNKVRSDYVDPYYLEQKFELGAALFIGWGGSCLLICGSAVMCYFSTYMLPGSARTTTVIIPPSHQSYRVSRVKIASGGRRGTQESKFSRTVRPLIDSAV
ncbi:Claudin-10 [Labeo rohita]|uniref:Claudin-10 n=1 Tax=Labeo rohita TaxID=84645 RepID=A0ABQ8MK74_LABRO|nr:Claudin-10 [Labeo rohita]